MREDVKIALENCGAHTFGNKRNIEKAEALLENGEKVVVALPSNVCIVTKRTGKKETLPGIVFLTNKRFIFNYSVLLSTKTEIVAVNEIRTVNCYGDGISGSHVQVHTLTKSYDILVSGRAGVMHKIQSAFDNARNSSFAPNQTIIHQSDALDQIEKLAALKEKGIITEEEFQQKKAVLLSKI